MFDFGSKNKLYRAAFAELAAVCERAAKGDMSARIVHTAHFGELAPTLAGFNRVLDLTDAFIRESGASLQHASEGKYYRAFLLRGMHGDFERGAQLINAARESMRANSETAARMEREMAEQKAEMERRAKAERARLADDFEAGVLSIVDTVRGSSEMLAGNAVTMSAEIEAVRQKSENAADQAQQATNNTQAVAAAAEQLAASVTEISRQIGDSRTASQAVADEVGVATETVTALDQANAKIDEVVEFIKSVAFQTNLLALNASVEAARAGEAGKGFAVVAQEVRNLAQKTAEAAKSIAEQIAEIKRASERTVDSIRVIREQAVNLNDRVATITDSVKEQSSATADISNNIQGAASRTEAVSSNVSDISASAGRTGEAAGAVASESEALRRKAEELARQVADFLAFIRRM